VVSSWINLILSTKTTALLPKFAGVWSHDSRKLPRRGMVVRVFSGHAFVRPSVSVIMVWPFPSESPSLPARS
jgi:hypothetical protein